jgi:hypothetical protein
MDNEDIDDGEETSSFTVEEALSMYEEYKSFWSDNYNESVFDLKLAAGDPAAHWGDAYDDRIANRQLTLVINELPQFIHQVTNDIRQNTPSVETIPDADGDIETAAVYSDLMRDIEYKSAADEAYDTAAEYAVKCGIGFIRVDHDYISDDSDEQELIIKKVPDPLVIWIDPASVECDGRDMNGAICLEPINKKTFERLYKGKKFTSFTAPKDKEQKDTIILGEVFIREFTGKHGKTPIIRRYKFSGEELLAETTFPGEYIPIVPVIGEDVWIDGKRILAGLIRQARDPQLRLNHWAVKEQQLLNMAPIAPVMAVEGTLVNENGEWQSPGTSMVLQYKQTDLDGNPAAQPTRLAPPPVPTGIINAMEGAKQNIKESMGMYNASIGERSNETSGIAIQRRQQEGDVATFHFPDNTRRSITQVGRIITAAVPTVYDTPRIVQTMTAETEPKLVGINGKTVEGQKRKFDLTKGKYRIRVTTGASYTTKRQQEAEFLSNIARNDPNFMQIGGDMLFGSMDSPGSQVLAARYKKLIPPNLLAENDDMDEKAMQLQQALQQSQQLIQQLQQALESKQAENHLKMAEIQVKGQELQVKQMELGIKAQELQQPDEEDSTEAQIAELMLKQREVEVKEYEAETKRYQAMQKQPEPASQGIKVDTTGFQMMKTPLQEQLEAEEAERLAQEQFHREEMEAAELMLKQQEIDAKNQQAAALIGTLGIIAEKLDVLTVQSAKPIEVIRDENGVIVGAS